MVAPIKEDGQKYYSGFVVEEATTSNAFRYLIQFDTGHVAYLAPNEVFVNYNQDKRAAIEAIHQKNSHLAQFLQKIFESPNCVISKIVAKRGDRLRLRTADKWRTFAVIRRDCSLIKVKRTTGGDDKSSWIYRGSYVIEENFKRIFPDQVAVAQCDEETRVRSKLRPRRDRKREGRQKRHEPHDVEVGFRSLVLHDIGRDDDSDCGELSLSDDREEHFALKKSRPEQSPRPLSERPEKRKPSLQFNPYKSVPKSSRMSMPFFKHTCDRFCLNFGQPEVR